MKLSALSPADLAARLKKAGLSLQTGPFTIHLQTPITELAPLLNLLYAEYCLLDGIPLADIHVRLEKPFGPRRWWRPQVLFSTEGKVPFAPFPADHALPLLEWGLNWCVATRAHQYLMLHSGVMEKDGQGILFPAWPGSGKSTLCAALAHRGWRLLSDEFGLVRPGDGLIEPFPRLIPLKNESIAVIRKFAPGAVLGPIFPKTRKGEVAHMRPPSASIEHAHEPVCPAHIVFPRYQPGFVPELQPMPKARAFLKLSGNAFNYEAHGSAGFRTIAKLVDSCDCYSFSYGDLDAAVALMNRLVQ